MFISSACGHRTVLPPAPEEKALYEQGLKAVVKKEHQIAQEKLSELLSRFPTSRWLPGIHFNLGLALEGLGRLEDAANNYKKVVEFYQGVHTREEAEALYRLSYCYETLGQDEKTILTLLELDAHAQYLGADAATMEVPARLAAAYARAGNMEQSRLFYSRAEKALKKRRRAPLNEELTRWLPKTLYSMGRIPPLKITEDTASFKNHVQALEQSQGWLLRATELSSPIWSQKASGELVSAYKYALELIQSWPKAAGTDKVRLAEERLDAQKEMSMALDKAAEKLKLERVPSTPEEPELPEVKEIFSQVIQVQKKLDAIIAKSPVRDDKTPEAQKRGGLRQGR